MLMRKFTFLAALALMAGGASAQSVDFVHNDEVLADGATVKVTELYNLSGDYYYLNPEVNLRNTGEEAVDFTLAVSNLEGELLAFCGMGGCVAPMPGVPVEKSGTIHPNETIDLEVHTMAFWNPAEAGYSKVSYELTYGDVTKTVTAEVDYDPTVSIDDVNAEKSVFVAGNQVVYSFDAPAARQLNVYSVTGALVKQEALESAGMVSLQALGKGIYLYEVVENGERVAARKCVVR